MGVTEEHGDLGDPVEAYLDALLLALDGPPRAIRRTLAEVEAHLLEAAEDEQSAGLSDAAARRRAVERFGPVRTVAGGFGADRVDVGSVVRRLLFAGSLVGGTGLIAVGIAGVVARLLLAVFGARFVGEVWGAGDYTAADCARWTAGAPGVQDCTQAMALDHAGDFILETTAAGIVGVLVLTLHVVLRRRWRARYAQAVRPAAAAEWLGAALAAAAAVVLLGQGVNGELVGRTSGVGQLFSLGSAALVAAAFFALRRIRAAGLRGVLGLPG